MRGDKSRERAQAVLARHCKRHQFSGRGWQRKNGIRDRSAAGKVEPVRVIVENLQPFTLVLKSVLAHQFGSQDL